MPKQYIPYGQHFLDEDDIQAVVEQMRNGTLTRAPRSIASSGSLADYVGARHAVAVTRNSPGCTCMHRGWDFSGR
jgi:dTDP-4-amino-4,6-dideoxygalactose transaminase